MYEGTLIIEAYCHHRLFDKIDKPDDQKKYFLKIRYLNRGLDNINISDILRNPDTQKLIPPYLLISKTYLIILTKDLVWV
jgi:hypothetical protein